MAVRVGARGGAGRSGVRKLRRPVASAAAPSFNPLTSWTTGPVHAVWASDPAWTPPADGGAVSSWRNGGSVGGDVVQGTGAAQPTYRASTAAFNNKPTVQFDGTDDRLVVTVTAIPQPVWLLAIGSFSAGNDYIMGYSSSSDSGVGRFDATRWAMGAAGGLKLYTAAMTAGNPYMVLAYFDGAASTFNANGTVSTASDAGTGTLTRFALGAHASNAGSFLDGHAAYAAIFTTDPTALPEWASFKAWCLSQYGITVA